MEKVRSTEEATEVVESEPTPTETQPESPGPVEVKK